MTAGDEMRPTAAPKLTAQDFLRLPGFEDDGLRHELIDGEHVVTPSPAERHQRVSMELTVALANYLKATGTGRVYYAPFDVVLSDYDVVEPDVLVVLKEQLGIIGTKNVQGAPAIVIEILSPSGRHRDEVVKRELYARAGVGEYWIVDPEAGAIAVWRRSGADVLESAGALDAVASDVLTTSLLPGFSLALGSVFSES